MAPPGDEMLHGAEAIAAALGIVERISGHDARRVTGWATVELDRAERDGPAGFAPGRSTTVKDVPDDLLLGARCRLVGLGPGERELLLLEPATEGRIAASLARFGEGPVVLYLILAQEEFGQLVRAAGPAGLVLSTEAPGPFGPQRLVVGGSPWGAHLCVARSTGAATIEP
jgi:hypothetical protein